MYVKSAKLAHTYVMIPTERSMIMHSTLVHSRQSGNELRSFTRSLRNVSEWMAVNKEMFDFTGLTCDKIGIGYAGFRYQHDQCSTPIGR